MKLKAYIYIYIYIYISAILSSIWHSAMAYLPEYGLITVGELINQYARNVIFGVENLINIFVLIGR